MDCGQGVIFILTKEDILNLARENGFPEDVVNDRFLQAVKGGVGDLIALEIKKFIKELTD